MKGRFAAFLLGLLIVGKGYGQKNLIENGGFEQDLTGWNVNDGIKATAFNFYEGKNAAALLSFKGDQWLGMDQTIRLPKKTSAVEFSIAVQSLDIHKGAKDWNKGVVIVEFQNSGNKIGEGVSIVSMEGTHSWQRYSKKLVVPEKANSFRVMIALSECAGTLYVDDVNAHVIPLDSIPGQEPKNPLAAIKPDGRATAMETETKKWLVDKNAIPLVSDLYYNLKRNAASKILVGQQGATKSGVIDETHSWSNDQSNMDVSRNRSDFKTITGSYPAVYGFDFNRVTDFVKGNAWYVYEQDILRELAIDAYKRKGVLTFCWHVRNPVTDSSFYWEKSPVEAVSQILPGGQFHAKFKDMLKQIADFDKTLVDKNGQWIPVIFRPWHEMDGSWFWWGKGHCSVEQYKQLYQYTVSYLKDTLGVHNMLFAWSPDRNFTDENSYITYYPGDAYVDLVGFDEYEDLKPNYPIEIAADKIKIVSDFALQHNKIAAMTETGLQHIPDTTWFTQRLLKALTMHSVQLSYVLFWANSPWEYWIPYKGHPAENDFVEFCQNPYLQIGSNMPDLYQSN